MYPKYNNGIIHFLMLLMHIKYKVVPLVINVACFCAGLHSFAHVSRLIFGFVYKYHFKFCYVWAG